MTPKLTAFVRSLRDGSECDVCSLSKRDRDFAARAIESAAKREGFRRRIEYPRFAESVGDLLKEVHKSKKAELRAAGMRSEQAAERAKEAVERFSYGLSGMGASALRNLLSELKRPKKSS